MAAGRNPGKSQRFLRGDGPLIAAVVLFDVLSRKRIHPATACGGLLIVCSQPLRLAIAHTQVWAAFAAALLR